MIPGEFKKQRNVNYSVSRDQSFGEGLDDIHIITCAASFRPISHIGPLQPPVHVQVLLLVCTAAASISITRRQDISDSVQRRSLLQGTSPTPTPAYGFNALPTLAQVVPIHAIHVPGTSKYIMLERPLSMNHPGGSLSKCGNYFVMLYPVLDVLFV